MSTEVRTRLTGDLEDDFNKFRRDRRLSLSEATQALISRGLNQETRQNVIEQVAEQTAKLEAQRSVGVQTLMIVQRLLAAIDEEQLEAARNDARDYLRRNSNENK